MGTAKDESISASSTRQKGNFPMPRSRVDGASQQQQQQHHHSIFLPSTAPVSSLLPSIPAGATHHAMVAPALQALVATPALQALVTPALQAQLAALLTHGAAAAQQQQLHHSLSSASSGSNSLCFAPTAVARPSQLLARTATGSTVANNSSLLSIANNLNMQHWSLDRLENHVKLLHQLKQPVPPNVTLLLEDARSRAEKRHAKRVANRKSASSSRARKKALVEEMAALNARLRRQALILSLLPDLVIVIDSDGRITFCSAQVERVLQFSIDDLIGAKLSDIIVPGSRDKLQNLIQELLSPSSTTQQDETDAAVHLTVDQDMAQQQPDDLKLEKKTKVCQVKKGDGKDTLAELSGDARVVDADAVKNLSFPLSVVQVDPAAAALASSDENDNSDGSNNSKQPSSLTNSLLGISELDGKSPKKDDHGSAKSKSVPNKAKRDSQSSKSCHTSSTESNDAKNLICANANLERNVRWHNKKIMKDKRVGYKDDVLGAAVTANNASARLSSLQHRSSDSSEEDSGYRESNDSREETSSSEGETLSSSNGRRTAIAPSCNLCLIREDLSTVWCEVTSSVRTKDIEAESDDSTNSIDRTTKKQQSTLSSSSHSKKSPSVEESPRKRSLEDSSWQGSDMVATRIGAGQLKEILFCLRPIRDGDEKTGEAHRFKPSKKKEKRIVSEDNRSEESHSTPTNSATVSSDPLMASSKKRSRPSKLDRTLCSNKRNRATTEQEDIDNAVVESLMAMSNRKP